MRKNETDQAAHINRQGRQCGGLCTSARDAVACHGKPDMKTALEIRVGIEGERHETLDLV